MADLDVLQDVAVGQAETTDVFGLSQVPVQPLAEVHHVVLSGVDLSESRTQRAASPLKVLLLAAPLLLQLGPVLLHRGDPAQLGALGLEVGPQRLRLLPQELQTETQPEDHFVSNI